MRVLFWGTPEFAAVPLRALIGEGFEVVGIVTRPDKPQGRARKVTAPPVKDIALEEKIPCFQPVSAKDPEFLDTIEAMKPDISVVVAYGNILTRRAIDIPAHGTLNIHASLLPALRGAAPIQAAIRQGLTETGITIMRMIPALDAGPVILQASVPILDDETYGELQLRLSELGAVAVIEALALLSVGEAIETPQDDSTATYAAKVTRDDARINWLLPAAEVAGAIRAYDPRPGAYTMVRGGTVKFYGPRVVTAADYSDGQLEPGMVLAADTGLIVACGDGALEIHDVQPSGKSRMTGQQWIRGRGVAAGEKLGV